jgi:hypothetical protein
MVRPSGNVTMGKLKAAGVIFLVCLALGAGWALWMGLKLFAYIAFAGLVIGVVAGAAMKVGLRRKLAAPDDRSRLG